MAGVTLWKILTQVLRRPRIVKDQQPIPLLLEAVPDGSNNCLLVWFIPLGQIQSLGQAGVVTRQRAWLLHPHPPHKHISRCMPEGILHSELRLPHSP